MHPEVGADQRQEPDRHRAVRVQGAQGRRLDHAGEVPRPTAMPRSIKLDTVIFKMVKDPSAQVYPVPELQNLPEDLRTRILEVQAKAGFVPNVFLALAHRPAEWRAFMAYHDALLLKDTGSLTKGDREIMIVATCAANHCLYCVVAHGAILRVDEKTPLVADQVAVNHRKADITPRQSAPCSTSR